eukprot:TRINITY_DN50085_c0_g1_i1.p2 TRINITY_DN50085_c0_g1~~TRINITY_DN50085_c0_g1_i1.p2  ORF type:complete len:371 (+),score=133.76 TRINITY_DN50085_c0_g1_i1:87-1199(+)
MALLPRVFVHAASPILSKIVTDAAAAVVGTGQVKPLPGGAPSWVRHWSELAGNLDDDESYDVLVSATDSTPAAPGLVASCSHALFRKRIPVLICSQGGTAGDELSAALDLSTQPLAELRQCSGEGEVASAVAGFLKPVRSGKIFTIEGGDGAGKQTQTAMLVERLRREGYPAQTIDFPHDSAKYGKEIRTILSGKHGSISEVSPLLFSTIYSMNRNDLKPVLLHWLRRGNNVVLDRYMESNYGHQAAKLEDDKARQRLVGQLSAYECKWLGNPASSRVVYLDLDPEEAMRAMQGDAKRARLDIHETAKGDYKSLVRRCFRWCSSELPGWSKVECCEAQGADSYRRLSREEVHEAVWAELKGDFVNGCQQP